MFRSRMVVAILRVGDGMVPEVTGDIGKATVEHLLKKGIPATHLIRHSQKGSQPAQLAAKSIKICVGDYFNYDSYSVRLKVLTRSFKEANSNTIPMTWSGY